MLGAVGELEGVWYGWVICWIIAGVGWVVCGASEGLFENPFSAQF